MCFKKLFKPKTKEITGVIYFNPTVFVNGIKDIFKDSLKIQKTIYSIETQVIGSKFIMWINTSSVTAVRKNQELIDNLLLQNKMKDECIVIIDDFRLTSPFNSTYGNYEEYIALSSKIDTV